LITVRCHVSTCHHPGGFNTNLCTDEPFRKNFYTEPSEISEMTPEEVADLRLELDGIKVKPSNVPRPVVKWAQMGLSQATLNVIQDLGFERPTSIQAQAIPIILSGRVSLSPLF
jgi:ATP-dependent RNA helicase DDX46/PRP5